MPAPPPDRRSPSFAHAVTTLVALALAAVVVLQQIEIRESRDRSSPHTSEVGDEEAAARAVTACALQRLRLMHDVARGKWNEKKPIDDPAREAAVLEGVLLKASGLGLDLEYARPFFEDQFTAAKIVQRADFELWKGEGRGRFDEVPDLAGAQRPRIDAATDALLDALARWSRQERDQKEGDTRGDGRSTVRTARLRRLIGEASQEFASPADPVRRALRGLEAR